MFSQLFSTLKNFTIGTDSPPPEEKPAFDADSHVWCLAQSNGEHLFAGDGTGSLQAWKLGATKAKSANVTKAHDGTVYALCVHDGMLFSGGADGTVRAWKINAAANTNTPFLSDEVAATSATGMPVLTLVTRDARTLYAGGADGCDDRAAAE